MKVQNNPTIEHQRQLFSTKFDYGQAKQFTISSHNNYIQHTLSSKDTKQKVPNSFMNNNQFQQSRNLRSRGKDSYRSTSVVNMYKQLTLNNKNNEEDNQYNVQLGKILHKLQTRIEGNQVKISSLTNVVRLLQKYTESKDIQYEKEKENALFNQTVDPRVTIAEDTQIQNKIKQFNILSTKMKRQCDQIGKVRQQMQRSLQNYQDILSKIPEPSTKNVEKDKGSYRQSVNSSTNKQNYNFIDHQEITIIIEEMQSRLRQQINKKTQICMKQINKLNLSLGQGLINLSNSRQDYTNGIDAEEELNQIKHKISQLENISLRNKMSIQRYIQDEYKIGSSNVVIQSSMTGSRARHSRKLSNSRQKSPSNVIRRVDKNIANKDKDRSSSPSLRNTKKSPFTQKNRNNSKSKKILDKKRIKEQQLMEAIARKKQNKEKLKQKFF